jgi:16S rRNA (adenine1518-N6/adenine1519-N6)-dimethyltransferase
MGINLFGWTKARCEELGILPDTEHRGQHFLVDEEVRDKLAQQIPSLPVIEIGAGLGILTEPLAQKGFPVTAIEIDSRFVRVLEPLAEKYSNLRVVFANVLTVDFSQQAKTMRAGEEGIWLTGSLPYQILEPLMLRLARRKLEREVVAGATFLISQRSARELVKQKPPRGKLGLLATALFDPEISQSEISREAFWPQPRTTSAIVNLRSSRSNELLASPHCFLIKELFFHPGGKIKSVLGKGLIAFSSAIQDWQPEGEHLIGGRIVLTKNQAQAFIEQLELPPDLLKKSIEQLNTHELILLDKALLKLRL